MSKPLSPIMQLCVAFLLVIALAIVACLIYSEQADGSELGTRSDLQVAVYDRMVYDSLNTRYPPATIRRWLDLSLTFVESHCKCNIEMDTIRMNRDSIFYALPTDCVDNGILKVAKMVDNDLVAMMKRPITDYGKSKFKGGEFYSVIRDTLLVHAKPDKTHLMYLWFWKLQPDIATGSTHTDTTVIWLPAAYRPLVVDYTEALYHLARGDRQTYKAIRDDVLQAIYMMAAEPAQEIQGFGIDTIQ